MATQALQKQTQIMGQLRGVLEKMQPNLQKALPAGLVADRMIQIALSTVQKTPKLLECTSRSVLAAVVESCQLGLPLDGTLGHAYPVPFKTKSGASVCQLMIGYRGYVLLAWRSARVTISAALIYNSDKFEFRLGTDPKLLHTPAWQETQREAVGAYAVAEFPDGRKLFEVMNVEQINERRNRSQAYRYAEKTGRKDSPWHTDWDPMAKKTIVRELVGKRLPLSADVVRAANVDAAREVEVVDSDVIDAEMMDAAQFAADLKAEDVKQRVQAGTAASEIEAIRGHTSRQAQHLIDERLREHGVAVIEDLDPPAITGLLDDLGQMQADTKQPGEDS